ncbi:MAG: beta-eliminating lyase-related protein [Ignavibacteriales bacterium]|nr:beta-eliminating lyase-related protein [Ignavibacteriales bacterium]
MQRNIIYFIILMVQESGMLAVATGISAKRICFNILILFLVVFQKDLALQLVLSIAGSKDFIKEAYRVRKAWGGGMRQVGILAAAALYALQNNIERLKEDHRES